MRSICTIGRVAAAAATLLAVCAPASSAAWITAKPGGSVKAVGATYEIGTGYGHIALTVEDLDATLGRLKDEHGIEPERPPYTVRDGGARICFVRDPDQYRVEIIERNDY